MPEILAKCLLIAHDIFNKPSMRAAEVGDAAMMAFVQGVLVLLMEGGHDYDWPIFHHSDYAKDQSALSAYGLSLSAAPAYSWQGTFFQPGTA